MINLLYGKLLVKEVIEIHMIDEDYPNVDSYHQKEISLSISMTYLVMNNV